MKKKWKIASVMLLILILTISCDKKESDDKGTLLLLVGLLGQTAATPTSDSVPSGLSYSTPTATYTAGSAITKNSPSLSSGTATSWSVVPALTSGLSISSTDGSITGTPGVTQSQTTYTVPLSEFAYIGIEHGML